MILVQPVRGVSVGLLVRGELLLVAHELLVQVGVPGRVVADEALLVLGEARRVRPPLRVVRAELAVEVPGVLALP